MKKEIKRSMITAILLYVFMIAGLTIAQRHVMYAPFGNHRPDHSQAPWIQKITITTQDNLDLEGWYHSAPTPKNPTIIHFHGNAGNIEYRIPKTIHYTKEKYGLLLAEYRGFGGNPGKPTEQGLYNDARAYMNWLIKEQNIKPENIIIHGESLGSGVATQMATEYKIKALILETPFTSAIDVAKRSFFFIPPFLIQYLIFDKYKNNDKIQSIKAPIFIGLAENDAIVPSAIGQNLFKTANEPKSLKTYKNANHNNLHQHGFAEDSLYFVNGL